jgi:hypothetical protein
LHRQADLQALEQQGKFGFGLRVTGERELAAFCGRDVYIANPAGGGLLLRAARGEPRRQLQVIVPQLDRVSLGQVGAQRMAALAPPDAISR